MSDIAEFARRAFGGGVHFRAVFRFHLALSKDHVISEMGLLVDNFRAWASGGSITPRHGTEKDFVMLSLARIRSHKILGLTLVGSKETKDAMHKIHEIQALDTGFFIALGVQKKVDGRLGELYVLRDRAAKVNVAAPMIGDNTRSIDGHSYWTLALKLSQPEILVGSAANTMKVI